MAFSQPARWAKSYGAASGEAGDLVESSGSKNRQAGVSHSLALCRLALIINKMWRGGDTALPGNVNVPQSLAGLRARVLAVLDHQDAVHEHIRIAGRIMV